MTVTENGRATLLHEYGRYYGEQHFAVAFTAGTEGPDAKRIISRGWDKTAPLADGDYGASYVSGRGGTKNPAIVLRPSNLIVLECDTEDDLLRIESLALPETVTVRSSEPYKRHYYYRPAPDLESLPYVAFRFESGKLTADAGRYFLAPPSIHPSGAVYSFLPDRGPKDIEIATLDAGVYLELAAQAHVEDDQQREAIELDPTTKFRAGSRRDALFRYACMLRRWGLPHAEILQQTLRYNDLKCDPPVDRLYVEVQVDGAMKKKGGQEFTRPETAPHPADLEVGTAAGETHDSWLPIDLNTLPAKPPVPPTLGGVGIVYPGKRHVFSGPQESAKTLAAYAIGIEVIRAGGTIVLIDFEMGGYDARGRLHELGATPEEIRQIRYLEPEQPANDERVNRLIALRPQLVIVDAAAGAYDMQGLDDNKRGDVERIARLYVRGFWRNGIATIFIDHVVKNLETRGKYAIGSERKVGGADVHLGFETILPIQRGSTGLYKITTHKDRGGFLQRGRLADLHLSSDPSTHSITWQFRAAEHVEPGELWLPTIFMEKISTLLATSEEPLSRNQIQIAISGNNDKKRDAIDHLVRLKYVDEEHGPRGSRLYSHILPFTVSEWEKEATSTTSPDLAQTSPRRGANDFASSPPSTEGRGEVAGEEATPPRPTDDPELDYLLEKYVNNDPDEDPPADLFDAPATTTNDDDLPL